MEEFQVKFCSIDSNLRKCHWRCSVVPKHKVSLAWWSFGKRFVVQTLRQERRPIVGISRNTAVLQCGRFIWRLILQFNEEGLEFKVVLFYANTCGSTVW